MLSLARSALRFGSRAPAAGLAALLRHALLVRRERLALSHLDAHLLRDIGLTPGEAHVEASRAIWDVPPHWRA